MSTPTDSAGYPTSINHKIALIELWFRVDTRLFKPSKEFFDEQLLHNIDLSAPMIDVRFPELQFW